ncbi:alpha/beta fold hydrolase [Zhongshania sp.]|uniref:alpha/beta fold hydrolase n=1 Tax=Zhongshania sp. TaxID=1971902 RepID=UPI00356A2861
MLSGKSEEQFIDVPGGRVYVRQWLPAAPAALPPVVLLHDSLGCVALWRDFPAQLAQRLGRKVIAYDRLGFGKSSERVALPSHRFIDEEAESIFPSLCYSLGLERVVILGHSVGGGMGVAIAALHADRNLCVGLITESAQPFIEERTTRGIVAAKQYFSNPLHFKKLVKYHGSKARWVLAAWTETWLDPDFSDWSLLSHLKNVQCPVLAIHGDNDEYGSVAFPNFIAESISGYSRSVIFERVGHVPHKEEPATILTTVSEFLAEVEVAKLIQPV